MIIILHSPGLNGSIYFRVRAKNNYGLSEYSNSSIGYDVSTIMATLSSPLNSSGLITVSTISVSIVSFLILVCVTLYFIHRNRNFPNSNKKSLNQISPMSPDLELANIRELPLSPGFIDANNPMYRLYQTPTDEELEIIPKIKRCQISLTKFLGSGAFGEVYEGLVQELDSSDGDSSKIAVKTLRKGASDFEKGEFLKEAKLMWNFKHDHILSLIAICLDNDPNFLILELMEGGDLLSYLRSRRPNAVTGASNITMLELVNMCLDVARGCEYLEQLHFVHRDIAARNCLVSSLETDKRKIKIGDFGLARDIYKNDYYKKEGEGLLPVRWMSPESLSDGVFTNQSDVWSFGVLIWEILTLGAKPYPAQSNREVLQYVRLGGRLDRPSGSPERLHVIMSSCWNQLPDDRPSFKMCVQEIECLLERGEGRVSEISDEYIQYDGNETDTNSDHNAQHCVSGPVHYSRGQGGCSTVSNSHYHSATTASVSSPASNSLSPPYLELINSGEKVTLGRGEYETPRHQHVTNSNSQCSCVSGASQKGDNHQSS